MKKIMLTLIFSASALGCWIFGAAPCVHASEVLNPPTTGESTSLTEPPLADSAPDWTVDYKKSFLLHSEGKTPEALEAARAALESASASHGTESLEAADANAIVGFYQYALGSYAQAEIFYQRALSIVLKKLGSGDDRAIDLLNDLAVLYQDSGDWEDARRCFGEALKAIRLSGRESDPRLAEQHKAMGDFEQAIGNFGAAEDAYREALRIVSREAGPSDLRVASAMGDLARNEQFKGNYVRAVQMYQSILQILVQKGEGEEEPAVMTMNNLAVSYALAGQEAEAREWYQRALGILLAHKGPEDPGVLQVVRNATQSLGAIKP